MQEIAKADVGDQRLFGRYLIRRKGFFGFWTKKIASVYSECIVIDEFVEDKNKKIIYWYSDIVKIYPNYKTKAEFDITVQKSKINETYFCNHTMLFMKDYYLAIDQYIIHKITDPEDQHSYASIERAEGAAVEKQMRGQYEDSIRHAELKFCLNNVSQKEHYIISFYLLRGGFKMSLLNTDNSCGTKTYLLIGEKRTNHTVEFSYLNIKEVISELNGMRVILLNSERHLNFIIENSEEKNTIIEMIRNNAYNYLDWNIKVSINDTSSSLIGKKMSKDSEKKFMCYFKGFSQTLFGDINDIEIYVNNLYIYEIKKGIIHQRIKLSDVIEIIREERGVPNLRLVFGPFESVTYFLRTEDFEIFTSNLMHILETCKRKKQLRVEMAQSGEVIFQKKLHMFQVISYVETPLNEQIKGMEHSIDHDKLAYQGLYDIVSYQKEFINRIKIYLCNSELATDIEHEELWDNICQSVVESAFVFKNAAVKEVARYITEHKSGILQNLFLKLHDQGIMEMEIGERSDFFTSFRKERDAREIDLKQKLDYLSNSVQEYEVFLFQNDF